MLKPCLFTQSEFAHYAQGLLAGHDIEFIDEDKVSSGFKTGGDHDELAKMACSYEESTLRLSNADGYVGEINLINEYDYDAHCQTVEIDSYTNGCHALMPASDE